MMAEQGCHKGSRAKNVPELERAGTPATCVLSWQTKATK